MTPSRFPLPALLLTIALALPLTAAAQPLLDWNRKLVDVSIAPSAGGPSGTYDITVQWLFELDGDGTVSDLGTDANVTWGPPVARALPGEDCLIWDIKDGCTADCATGATGPCGDASVDGIPTTLTCDPGVERCRSPVLSGVVPGVAVCVCDEITVILYPSPGAVPDGDTSDDSLTITLGATGVDGTREPSSWTGVKARYR